MAALWSPHEEPVHFHLWANGTSSGGYGILRHVTLSHCGGGEEMMESESMSDWTDAHPQKPWTMNAYEDRRETQPPNIVCFVIQLSFLLLSVA